MAGPVSRWSGWRTTSPRAARARRSTARRLAWIGLVLFNVAAVAGTVALDLGYNAGDLEYREWPWPIRLDLPGRAGRHRLEPDRHRRATQHRRHLSVQLVHDRRGAVDLHHRARGDPALVSVRPRPGVGVRLLHAQRRRHVVYAAGARHLLLRVAEAPEPADLLLCARRVRVLDQPGVLPDHRRASLPVQPAALVAADHGDRVQRRHAGAGVGRQRQFPPDDARPRWATSRIPIR